MESLDNIEAHIEETIEFVKGQIDDEEGNSSDLNSIQEVYDNIADIKDRFDELPTSRMPRMRQERRLAVQLWIVILAKR